MKPEVAKKWAQALRSGKYKKVEGRLQDRTEGPHAYCALGVLCDIARKEGVPVELMQVSNGCELVGGGLSDQPEVARWAGIEDTGVICESHSIPMLNDEGATDPDTGYDEPLTFDEIADLVEIMPEEIV